MTTNFNFTKKQLKNIPKNILEKQTREIKNKALKFAKFIESQGIPIEKVIIFGSYAKNKAGKESDIGICLVSPKFGKDSIEELQFLLKQRRNIDTRIEPIPVFSQEYRESVSPLIFEIKKFGKEIVAK